MKDFTGSIMLILPCHVVAKSEFLHIWQLPLPSSTKTLHCLQTRFIFFSPFFLPLPFLFLPSLLRTSPFPCFPPLSPPSRLPFPLQRPPQAIRACQALAGALSARFS